MGGGCVEGQELSGATAPGRVGADGHDRSFVEEGGEGAAEVCAGGVQCLAELRSRRRGEGEVGDDTVLEGGEGVARGVVHVRPSRVCAVSGAPPRPRYFYDMRH